MYRRTYEYSNIRVVEYYSPMSSVPSPLQAQKLEVLRQKKLEYLEFQRQLHLARMREQEADMRARLEQERSMVQQRTMTYNVSSIIAHYDS